MMFGSFAKNLFAARMTEQSEPWPLVQQINAREADFAGLGDDALRKCLMTSDRK